LGGKECKIKRVGKGIREEYGSLLISFLSIVWMFKLGEFLKCFSPSNKARELLKICPS